ncbi:thioredoxin family protein [bacterium]|nr:thioredoxin family protein [bacterium]
MSRDTSLTRGHCQTGRPQGNAGTFLLHIRQKLSAIFFVLAWLFLPLVVFAEESAIFDNFEDHNLRSEVGWTWDYFAKGDAPTIGLMVDLDDQGSGYLMSRGTLPDDGTGFTVGGIFCAPADRETNPVEPIDFSSFDALAFRAASDRPAYYNVRIEQKEQGYNSTNVAFPVTEEMQDFLIPLSEFKSGTSQSTAMAFTCLVDEPGAIFHLKLDDIRFVRGMLQGTHRAGLEARADWAATPKIGWQNARFHNKPMLFYFSSRFALPCQLFEERLIENQEFPELAREFVLARVDVNQYQSLVRRYNVWRVPSFIVLEPASGRMTSLYSGARTAELALEMRNYLKNRPEKDMVAQDVAPSQRYHIVHIDDFTDRNDINEVGGHWGTYAMGDRGDIDRRIVDLGGGNLALQVAGVYPGKPGDPTYGGVYCDLAPDRGTSRDLSKFRWISFICRSSESDVFQIHLEDGNGAQAKPQQFHASADPARVTIPLASFGDIAGRATTIVWSEPNPMPGRKFELVLDDVMVIR